MKLNLNRPLNPLLTLTMLIASALSPAKAQAMILLDVVSSPFLGKGFATDDEIKRAYFDDTKTLCWVMLPLCLMDEKAGDKTLGYNDLVASGLSAEAATSFISQSNQLSRNLYDRRMSLRVGKSDTRSSIAGEIREVMPSATRDFVRFYSSLVVSHQ